MRSEVERFRADLLTSVKQMRRGQIMKRTYSAWGSIGDEIPHTLVDGEGPPRFASGEAIQDCELCLWRVEVCTYEEAKAIFNLRCGFAPYIPLGEAEACPGCGAPHYPHGSGQCWRCTHTC